MSPRFCFTNEEVCWWTWSKPQIIRWSNHCSNRRKRQEWEKYPYESVLPSKTASVIRKIPPKWHFLNGQFNRHSSGCWIIDSRHRKQRTKWARWMIWAHIQCQSISLKYKCLNASVSFFISCCIIYAKLYLYCSGAMLPSCYLSASLLPIFIHFKASLANMHIHIRGQLWGSLLYNKM